MNTPVHAFMAYTPASDTVELRADLRGAYWNTETVKIPMLALRPAVEPIDRWAADLWWFLKRAAGLVVVMVALLALSAGPADARPGGPEKDTYSGPTNPAVSDVRDFFNGFWSVTR